MIGICSLCGEFGEVYPLGPAEMVVCGSCLGEHHGHLRHFIMRRDRHRLEVSKVLGLACGSDPATLKSPDRVR